MQPFASLPVLSRQRKEAAEAEKKKASAALEQLRHEKSATLLRSQQAETKANAAEAKKEALRMATEEMIALLRGDGQGIGAGVSSPARSSAHSGGSS